MTMDYYFDTNIFRRYADGTITESILQEFIDLSSRLNRKCFTTPVTVVELGSHLTELEAARFEVFKKSISGINTLCRGAVLPEPDALLRKLFLGIDLKIPEEDSWAIFCDLVCRAKTLDDLTTTGIEFKKGGKRFRGRIDSSVLPKFREDYEGRFISAMWSHVIPSTSPNYAEYKNAGHSGGIKDEEARKEIIKFIWSNQFGKYFFDTIAERCGALLIGDSQDTVELQSVLKRLCAFESAYRWILAKIAEAGYNFEKKKNDYADIHFLIYLLNENLIFVTNDNHLYDKVSEKCAQRSRIMTFDKALEELRKSA